MFSSVAKQGGGGSGEWGQIPKFFPCGGQKITKKLIFECFRANRQQKIFGLLKRQQIMVFTDFEPPAGGGILGSDHIMNNPPLFRNTRQQGGFIHRNVTDVSTTRPRIESEKEIELTKETNDYNISMFFNIF